jgi:hypothetical protein
MVKAYEDMGIKFKSMNLNPVVSVQHLTCFFYTNKQESSHDTYPKTRCSDRVERIRSTGK